MATLSDLMPSTNYTISVSMFNMVGNGQARSIQVQTRERRKYSKGISQPYSGGNIWKTRIAHA